jgi:pimeloyl-ACP methyl ester carboxylesterase
MGADFVFMHGGGQGSWVWEPTIAAMRLQSAGTFGRGLALDAPGCGVKRGRETSRIGFNEIVTELIADIDRAGMENVILVGHSQAGTVMPRMAEMRPDLFRRLIYVSCIAPLPGATVPETMGNGLRGENDAEIGWVVEPATHPTEERFRLMFCNDMASEQADQFLRLLGNDSWPICSYRERDWRYDHLVAVPTSYVVLLNDLSLPEIWQERFAKRLHADRLIRIDAGHQAMNTRPHALAEVLLTESLSR